MRRVWLAGVLGGLAMYLWSFVAHMATPLGTMGITQMANDQPLLAVLQQHAGRASSLFVYPTLGTGPDAMKEYAQKLAAWLLAQSRLERYVPCVTFVAMIGVVTAIATNVPYWNWYGFPGSYTAASMLVQIVGFLAVGLVAARVIGAGSAARAPVSV